MTIRNLFILTIFLGAPYVSKGQYAGGGLTSQRVMPPSPNAASLGKYGDIPVGYYTGTPQISIPLYEVKIGTLTLPITLNYHASGIRVEEEASWVGLGWSLDAGGVITRSIVGLDDRDIRGFRNTPSLPDVLPANGYIANFATHEQAMAQIACTPTVNGQSYDYSSVLSNLRGYDLQPDRYFFNFSGQSGQFIITKQNQVLISNQAKLKIDPSLNVITTADGTKYEFSQVEKAWAAIGLPEISASFYLTKITSPGGDEIFLEYESAGLQHPQPSLSESAYRVNSVDAPPDTHVSNESIHEAICLKRIYWRSGQVVFQRDPAVRQDIDVASLLKKIRIFTTNVANPSESDLLKEFELRTSYFIGTNITADYSRTIDLAYVQRDKRLRLDEVVERNGTLEKPPYSFIYSSTPLPYKTSYARDHWGFYNGAGNTTLIPPYSGTLQAVWDWEEKWTYLDLPGANREANANYMDAGILKQIIYPTGGSTTFEYEGHQGVYDGVGAKPTTYTVPHTAYVIPPAGPSNQAPDITFVGNGTVTDPTHVQIKFSMNCTNVSSFPYGDLKFQIFENGVQILAVGGDAITRSYGSCMGMDQPCTGTWCFQDDEFIQIKAGYTYRLKVIVPTGYDDKILDAEINVYEQYMSAVQDKLIGGLRIHKITNYDGIDHANDNIKVFQYSHGRLMTQPSYVRQYRGFLPSGSTWSMGTVLERRGDSNIPLGSSAQGSHIGYSTVSVLSGANGEYGKTVYTYHNEPDDISPYPSRIIGLPTFQDKLNGVLLFEEHFNTGGQSLKRIENHYVLTNKQSVSGGIGEWRLLTPIMNPDLVFSDCSPSTQNPASWIYYYEISSAWIQLLNTTETDAYFDASNARHELTKSTDYYYDNPVHYQPTRIVTSASDNTLTTSLITYPEDYTDASGFIKDLKDAFIVKPIEKIVVKEDVGSANTSRVISGQIATYKPGGRGLSDNIYALKFSSKKPIRLQDFRISNKSAAVTNLSNITANTNFYLDPTLYEKRMSFIAYDGKGNTQQLQKDSDSNITYLWGYSSTYPVAEIKNATYQDVVNAIGQAAIDDIANSITLSSTQLALLNGLRTNPSFKNAQITIYTYNRLIGVATTTDESGKVTYYDYDALGRLSTIRDDQQNIMKRYQYNYKAVGRDIGY